MAVPPLPYPRQEYSTAKGKHIQCPIDGTTLVIAERAGVEIDHCPKCRGVWLDRGELDKIIDRAAPQPTEPRVWPAEDVKRDKKKRGGFLEELFDF